MGWLGGLVMGKMEMFGLVRVWMVMAGLAMGGLIGRIGDG